MWIGDKVKVMEGRRVKRNKVKLKVKCLGVIEGYVGQIGLSDETSEFLIRCEDGSLIEETEDFLHAM